MLRNKTNFFDEGEKWMGKKKVMAALSAAALAGSLFSTAAYAKDDEGKGSLVALGDSITYGYNLSNNNNHVSKKAFPFIIGEKEELRVRDLGVPGWTTVQLLTALQTDEKFQESVKHAKLITLDIGSNDLLQAFAAGNLTNGQVASILYNLQDIIVKVRSLSNAPIVVYNIYNPFQVTDYRHAMGDFLLPGINAQILGLVASFHDSKIVIADAYDAIGQNQDIYVRANDIHPTVLGQQMLAKAGLEALFQIGIKKEF